MQIITDSRFTSIPNVITDSSLCALSQHTRVSHISNRTKKDNKQMKKKPEITSNNLKICIYSCQACLPTGTDYTEVTCSTSFHLFW